MKKIVNVFILIVIITLTLLLVSLKTKTEQPTNTTNQDIQETTQKKNGTGFADPDKLAEKYIDNIVCGSVEEPLKFMPKAMVETIAKENGVSVENVENALLKWYQVEKDYYDNRVISSYGDAGTFWSVNQLTHYEGVVQEEFDGEVFDIAGYYYQGIITDGFEKLREYSACVKTSKGFGAAPIYSYFDFLLGEIDGLWYLIGIEQN